MRAIEHPLPASALLRAYAERGAQVDCQMLLLPRQVSLHEYLLAFGNSPLFRLERALLSLAGRGSSAADVRALAEGRLQRFALWTVEARTRDQLLMAVDGGRIRSWWMAAPVASPDGCGTQLLFGSALLPRPSGDGRPGHGLAGAVSGLHRFYARRLLNATARRLSLSQVTTGR